MHDNRPRRSVLFMPGENVRALAKAKNLAADSLIFDLEDAVAPAAKTEARTRVIQALHDGGYGKREIMVRINALDTPWGETDVQGLVSCAGRQTLAGLVLPKVENARQVLELAQLIDSHAPSADTARAIAIWVMIESPEGVAAVDEIARAGAELRPNRCVLVLGTNDLGKALRIPHNPDRAGLITALSLCVLAARRYGLDILDGVYTNLDDKNGFEQQCAQGRTLGFDGKTIIHPSQIDACNRIFAPDPVELAQAHRLVAAWQEAQSQARGVVVVDGLMMENLHVEEANALLAKAQAIEALGH